MKTYLVGGAVRDTLLGLPVKDRDYVVVNANGCELMAMGYEQVGIGFPVFLHPWTREEYALARREKKTGPGYTGFEFETGLDVTLEEDLSRRDLTINSMAMDGNKIIDPFGGQNDLSNKILRHTSEAFSEDPLRVIRLARFYARYSKLEFIVADETIKLCKEIVDRGELDELPDERFWKEIEKAFDDKTPSKFFQFLFDIGALNKVSFFARLFGGVDTQLNGVMKLADACANFEAIGMLDVFVAWRANIENPVFNTSRSAKLNEMVVQFSDLSSSLVPTEIHQFLTRHRVFSESSQNGNDLILCIKLFEQTFGMNKLVCSSNVMAEIIAIGKSVTAEPFMHLSGKAIGEAMAEARIAKIATII